MKLINQIIEKTGIPADKAQQVLSVVAGFVEQKFPALGGQSGSGGSSENLLGDIGSKNLAFEN